MPREIVLGNGEMLVNLDRHLNIRDLYYPYVGWANHVGGHYCRTGVWTSDAGFAWLDDGWEWQIGYVAETLVTDCTARHNGLGLRLVASHTVLHDKNILLTHYRIENQRDVAREVRLFLAHDLRIDETDIGDTCCYYPNANAMIHYKRDRYFLFGGVVSDTPVQKTERLFQYACGEKGFRGAEGAWRDAEDGLLSMNAIAQGAVDSVHSFAVPLDARGSAPVRVWAIAGETMEDVVAQQAALERRTFDQLFRETADHWQSLVRDLPVRLDRLPTRVAELFTRSLLVMRTQIDKRGAILASNDTDIMETARAHYSYMWPRDGALVSLALDGVGLRGITQPFFEFCARVLPKDRAALMHKYGPDGTVGASWHPWIIDGVPETPFQEDGTALVIYALWKHVEAYGDRVFAAQIYARFVRPAADFLIDFRSPGDETAPAVLGSLGGAARHAHLDHGGCLRRARRRRRVCRVPGRRWRRPLLRGGDGGDPCGAADALLGRSRRQLRAHDHRGRGRRAADTRHDGRFVGGGFVRVRCAASG